MLQQENRLKKVRDFNLLMKHGFWVQGRFFGLKILDLVKIKDYIPKKEDPEKFKKQLKIAVSVGLKVSKGAVKRNRLKRQAREVARLLLKEGRVKPGFYVLVNAKKEALDKDYAEISQELELLFKRAGVLK